MVLPLVAIGWFSVRVGRGQFGLEAYREVLRDARFRDSLVLSLKLATSTVILGLALLVPTAYWIHLKLPRLRPIVEIVSVLPMVVPPIVLVVGLLEGFRWTPAWFYGGYPILVTGYVVLALPYVYRALDAGLQGADIRTLTEAAQTLGARWPTLVFRIIVPTLRSSILSAALLTLATAMGEFTMGLIMQFTTYAVYISYVWESRGSGAAALSVISFSITWLAMLGILFAGRRLAGAGMPAGGTR